MRGEARRSFLTTAAAAGVAAAVAPQARAQARADQRVQAEIYRFAAWDGPPLPVALARPSALSPDAPVVFVMHGVARGGAGYRDAWRAIAARFGALIAAPTFSATAFPGADGYQLGDVPARSRAGAAEARSHDAIEPLFDALRHRFGLTAARYGLYGHSAGAQFAHRFLLRRPDARAASVVAANAGWWLRPDPAIRYPYGLAGAPYPPEHAARAFRVPLTVLLGTRDLKRDGSLRQTPEAEAQGPHRLARGAAFFVAAERLAVAEQAPFRWRIAYAPGVGHSNREIAPFAARELFASAAFSD